jgi:hypothetical protein
LHGPPSITRCHHAPTNPSPRVTTPKDVPEPRQLERRRQPTTSPLTPALAQTTQSPNEKAHEPENWDACWREIECRALGRGPAPFSSEHECRVSSRGQDLRPFCRPCLAGSVVPTA